MKYRNQIVCCLPLLLALAGCHAAPDTPLTVAATEGRIQEVQTLLERGADPNAKDSQGWTALMWASRNGEAAVMQALLESGANPNTTDTAANGWTALMHAIHIPRLVEFLSCDQHNQEPKRLHGNS